MKTIKTIFKAGTFLAVFVFTSCRDFLDTCYNVNQTDELLAENPGSIWSFANAFYAPMQHGLESIDYNVFATVSDECQQTSPSSSALYFNKGIINENVNPIFNLYKNYYEGIRAAYFFLDYVADGKGEKMLAENRDIVMDEWSYNREVQSLNYYIAEAHIAIAYYYSELIKMYGGVPLIKKYYTDMSERVPRSTYEECVEFIVSEIDEWKNELSYDWSEFGDREGRLTYPAALAIKARTLLYAASPLNNPDNDQDKWKRAMNASSDIINLDAFSLNPVYDMFSGAAPLNSPETIFVIRTFQSSDPERANYPISTPGGRSGACPTEDLVEAYEYVGEKVSGRPYANRDPRFAASIVYNGCNWNDRVIAEGPSEADDMSKTNASRTGYYLRKFLTDKLNLQQGGIAQHNWIAYRYAEVLLNFAEAANEVYGPDAVPPGSLISAKTALQMVRDRASTSLPAVTASSKDAFRTALKHERRVELAFEDHRYWDLLRWKDAMDVLNKPVHGVLITKSSTGAYLYEKREIADRKFNEYNYRLPFLRSEIQNSNGTLEQNPGYNN